VASGWEVGLLTGGLAVVAALGAAAITGRSNRKLALQQAAADDQRAKEETERFKAQFDAEATRLQSQQRAELERLRLQHDEDHLRNREGTYVLLLDALNRAIIQGPGILARVNSDIVELKEAALERWQDLLDEAGHLYNAIRLFAPVEVVRAAQEVFNLTWRSYQEAQAMIGRGEQVLGPPLMADFNDAQARLLVAMRADVAPDRER
jgi:hypothetical protein